MRLLPTGTRFGPAVLPVLALLGQACTAAPRWVAVAGDGTLVVYDGSLTVADTLSLDSRDTVLALGFAPDGATLYAAANRPEGGEVRRLRSADGRMLGVRRFAGRRLDGLQVAPDARSVLAIVSSDAGGALVRLAADLTHIESELVVCDGPVRAVAVFAPADRLHALCADDVVATVDLALGTIVRTAAFDTGGACGATDLAVSANGTVLFALCPLEGRLLYLDHRTLALLESVTVGAGPLGMKQGPDARRAVLPYAAGRELVTVPLRERRPTPMAVPFAPQDVAISMDGRRAYVVGHSPATVALVDLRDGVIVASAVTVPSPQRVAVWPAPRTPVMRWSP